MNDLHEWLSGGVSPCQGEGRGFESRLVLSMRYLKKGFRKIREPFLIYRIENGYFGPENRQNLRKSACNFLPVWVEYNYSKFQFSLVEREFQS